MGLVLVLYLIRNTFKLLILNSFQTINTLETPYKVRGFIQDVRLKTGSEYRYPVNFFFLVQGLSLKIREHRKSVTTV